MVSLVRSSTRENWAGYMHDCYKSKGIVAIFFFVSFMIFNADILVNVFVAVIYENFE